MPVRLICEATPGERVNDAVVNPCVSPSGVTNVVSQKCCPAFTFPAAPTVPAIAIWHPFSLPTSLRTVSGPHRNAEAAGASSSCAYPRLMLMPPAPEFVHWMVTRTNAVEAGAADDVTTARWVPAAMWPDGSITAGLPDVGVNVAPVAVARTAPPESRYSMMGTTRGAAPEDVQ